MQRVKKPGGVLGSGVLAGGSGGRRGHSIPRNATVAPAAGDLPAGVHKLTLRAEGIARLARKLAVKLTTTYTPVSGAPRTNPADRDDQARAHARHR